jgi:integrase
MATIRRRGNRWQAQIRRDGHPALTSSHPSRRKAEIWARATEARLDREVQQGFAPAPCLAPLPNCEQGLTLADLVMRYMAIISSRKKGAVIEHAILRAFLRHPLCQQPVAALTSPDFAAYRDQRLGVVRIATVRKEFSILHHMFEVARKEWALQLPANPTTGLRLGAAAPSRERRLRPGEEQALLEASRACRNAFIRPMIVLAIETGLRRGELLGLFSHNVDLHRRVLLIPDSKNGSARHVVLTRRAVKVLTALPRSAGRVFPMSTNAFRLAWERVRRRAGLEDLHFHDLRHEALNRFFEMGLTTPEVASISGHRDARTLFRYSHPMRQRMLEVIDRLKREAHCPSKAVTSAGGEGSITNT